MVEACKIIKETIDDRLTNITGAMHYMLQGGMSPESCLESVIKLYNAENLDYEYANIQQIVTSAWEEIQKGDFDKRNSFKADVLDFIVSSPQGLISLNDCYKSVNAKTKDEMRAVRVAIHRIVQMGLIEPRGSKSGVYHKVDKTSPMIDFKNIPQDQKAIDLKWPFGLEKYCFILPKNIVIIAGYPDTGKTAFLLNFIKLNMEKHKIHYFSSEMGALELRTRLEKFPIPLDQWKFFPRERSSNFSDVIVPNEINVIDFLEVHQDFYMMGQWIKDIFDKLKQGIAIIAIQKDKKEKSSLGRGGIGSLEKPRLYITLDNNPHILTIVKAKNWINDMINPNGMMRKYKVSSGCHFHMEGEWEHD